VFTENNLDFKERGNSPRACFLAVNVLLIVDLVVVTSLKIFDNSYMSL